MKNALIVIGKELKYNSSFVAYLRREVEKSVGKLDMVLFVAKNDGTTSIQIRQTIDKYQNVIIAVSEGFELIGKIISTQISDNLIYKQNMLLPSKATEIDENSYKVKNINVLHIDVGKKIPKILIQSPKESGVFLFCDEADAKRFEKLASVFEIKSERVKIIDGVWKYSLMAKRNSRIERFLDESRELITDRMLLGDDLSTIIANMLVQRNQTITFAESCTGGLIASEFTKNSGVSSIFKGSIVSYADEVKHNLLGVSSKSLKYFGAVSNQTVNSMLNGAKNRFNSDFALAVSGVAGPDGGSREKPVGTIYVGVKNRENKSIIKKILLSGDRIYIQQSTMFWAFKLLVESDEKFFFKFVPKSLDK